jgi:hypothetical protein
MPHGVIMTKIELEKLTVLLSVGSCMALFDYVFVAMQLPHDGLG